MVLDFVESLKAEDVEYDGYGAVQVTVEGHYRYPEVKAYWNERADTVEYRIELADNAVDVTDDFACPHLDRLVRDAYRKGWDEDDVECCHGGGCPLDEDSESDDYGWCRNCY